MPTHVSGYGELPMPDDRAVLDRMPGSTVPVIRQPFRAGDMLPFWVGRHGTDDHHLYRLDVDPDEQENRAGDALELEMTDMLRTALAEIDAPLEQLERLGIS